MAVDAKHLRILHFPDPALRTRAQPVAEIDDNVRAVVDRMFELMREAEGVGLAAPQVGLPWRVFVTAAREGHPERIYVNPRLSNPAAEPEVAEEGCLSLPNIRVEVRRPKAITVTAQDLEGNEFTVRDEEFLARVWQHEFDHLEGILIIDRMSPMDRLANRKALRDLKSGVASAEVPGRETRA